MMLKVDALHCPFGCKSGNTLVRCIKSVLRPALRASPSLDASFRPAPGGAEKQSVECMKQSPYGGAARHRHRRYAAILHIPTFSNFVLWKQLPYKFCLHKVRKNFI
jgi:hypothetical protein